MRDRRLVLALALSVLAWLAALIGGPAPFRVLVIGAFVVFAPGLVLTHVLRISDALLSLVIMMMTGPSVWVLLATLAAFSGLWAPTTTIVVAAIAVGAMSVAPMLRRHLTGTAGEASLGQHQLSPDSIDEAVVSAPPSRSGRPGYDD